MVGNQADELINSWRDRVHQSRLRYETAKQLRITLVSRGVQGHALVLASNGESEAMEQYSHCLRTFSELVMKRY